MNNVLVIGAARSGVAAANFLAGRGIGVSINDAKPEKDVPLASKLDPPREVKRKGSRAWARSPA